MRTAPFLSMLMSVIVIIVTMIKYSAILQNGDDEQSLLDKVVVSLLSGLILVGIAGVGYAFLANYLLDDELF